jgi:lipopolysaccharide transport system ATP-binding protein
MAGTVIKIDTLGKLYRLGTTGTGKLADDLKQWLDKKMNDGEKEGYLWAIKNISLEVKRGEVLGIIGKNGAGKSTLLKIISRITSPTIGEFRIRGRIASLLEVGTGFHPELTGRENIFLNGAILGMSKAEIRRKFDEIVNFSGIEKYIDTPVKRYSSGMTVRLAFAVAAHLEPEIMIIDEVLAVGDAEFQKKCLGKMKDVAGEGRTILFVSHNMAAVKTLCTSAILLENGQITVSGKTGEVFDKYLESINEQKNTREIIWQESNAPGNEEVKLISVRTLAVTGETKGTFSAAGPIKIEISYKINKRLLGSRVGLTIKDNTDTVAFASTNELNESDVKEPGTYITTCIIPANLLNQKRYTIQVSIDIAGQRTLIRPHTTLVFDVITMGHMGSFRENWPGTVAPLLEWVTDKK